MEELTDAERNELLADLASLRDELVRAVARSGEDAKTVDLDMPIGRLSRVDAIQIQAMAKAQKQRLELRLKQCAAAFEAHGRDLVAIVEPGTSSPLDASSIDQGYDQGASGVFVAELDGEPVDLTRTADGFVDSVSGLTFNVFGRTTDGSGTQLESVEHLDTFWFALAAFDPDAEIWPG